MKFRVYVCVWVEPKSFVDFEINFIQDLIWKFKLEYKHGFGLILDLMC